MCDFASELKKNPAQTIGPAGTLLSAIGRLDVRTLGLSTPDYLPVVHYHQVRDAWSGVRTPSGR